MGLKAGVVLTADTDISFGTPQITNGYVYYLYDSATIEYDTGYGVEVAIGKKKEQFRVESEIGYRKADMDTIEVLGSQRNLSNGSELTTTSLMLNGYYDIATNTAWTPYIGAGLGFAKHQFEFEGESDDDTVFAYQLILGVAYSFNDNISLDCAYRYFGTADADFFWAGEADYGSHNITFGLRIKF